MSEEIKIYVADLAAYNNGKLHGVWIDALAEPEDSHKQIAKMLSNSPEGFSEEYAIHDHEGFGEYQLSEYEGIESAHEIACFIAEHTEIGGELLSHFCGDLDEARKAMDEQYAGLYVSLADYAKELTEDSIDVPERIAAYVDYDRMGRDMTLSGDIFKIEKFFGEVHIFWNH